jgi:hypothetical protein
MNEVPDFEDAVAAFQQLLIKEGHPSKILWLFREDIWKRSSSDLVRLPSQIKNLALTKKVFGAGRRKGLIDVHAIATIDEKVAATVWFPR